MLARSIRGLLRDAVARSLSLAGRTRAARWAAGRLTILTFHRVLPEELRRQYPLRGLCVTPEELGWVIDVVAPDFRIDSLAGAIRTLDRADDLDRPPLALTFDDAQLDNLRWAAPVLADRGVRATFFAPTDAVASGEALWHDRLAYALVAALERAPGETRAWLADVGVASVGTAPEPAASAVLARAKRISAKEREAWCEGLERRAGGDARPDWDGMMSFRELGELAEAGHEIGSHSVSHALLPQCSDAEIEIETRQSRETLQQELGTPIHSFCYPNGDADDRCEAAVERAGYRAAVTTRWGTNTRSSARLSLRRCDIHPDHLRDRRGALSQERLLWRLSGWHPGAGGSRG